MTTLGRSPFIDYLDYKVTSHASCTLAKYKIVHLVDFMLVVLAVDAFVQSFLMNGDILLLQGKTSILCKNKLIKTCFYQAV